MPRIFVGSVLLLLLPGFAQAFWKPGAAVTHSVLAPLLVGVVLGLLLTRLLARLFPAAELFKHELTHAVVALLCLRNITEFTVRHDGGYGRHSGSFLGSLGDDLIGLAP